ncbi:hypothetical protein [Sorangium cellulosum]|uniref:hypothetical protein n=1 Tax=Sorangium cellulosum TaxID=56 RepID=UPI0011DD61C8|nr:hypothetical protein [Sorangium cellulosum]
MIPADVWRCSQPEAQGLLSDAERETAMEDGFFGPGQSAAFDAIRAWHGGGGAGACVVYGPAGAGKGAVIDRFFASLDGSFAQRVLVRGGRAAGAPFEQEVLARLADGLWPDDAPHAEDRQGLCELLANEIANRDAEDGEPALLLGIVGPDACADWPEERERSVLGELGPSVRVLVSVSGPREAAERWAERLAVDVSTIAWVPVSGFRLDEIDAPLRDRLAWAAIDGPGPAAIVEATMGALRERGAARLEALLSIVARAFAPLDLGDAAALLDEKEAELAAALDARRAALDPVIAWEERWSALRFRHEALRAAWVAASEDGAARCERRFVEAARALLGARARASGRLPEDRAAGYLRRYAGDHLRTSGAPPADLLALCDPRWAWPSSLGDLAARRAELRRLRRLVATPLEAAGAPLEAAGAPLEAAGAGRLPEDRAAGYLRRYAGDHLRTSGAPPADLLALCDPRWAWPSSLGDLAARRAELRRLLEAAGAPLEAAGAPLEAAGAGEALAEPVPRLVRVALAQGALGTLHRAGDPRDTRPGDVARGDAERALAAALLALSARASGRPGEEIAARARELVRRRGAAWRGDPWNDAQALLAAARASSGDDAASFARWAVSATLRDEQGPGLPVWLAAARFLPPSEAEALVAEAVERARSDARPGNALAQLAAAPALDAGQTRSLFRAAMDLPPGSRVNALAPLVRALPEEERSRGVSALFDALLDGAGADGEPIDTASCTEALAPFLGLPEVSRLLDDPMTGMGAPLAVRLAELGETARALDVIEQLCGAGVHGAGPLLRAAATRAGRPLVHAAREAVASLQPAWAAAALVADHAAPAIDALGLDASVEIAERGGSSGQARIAALAALCCAAPAPSRPALAARAVAAYRQSGDTDGLETVIRCAAWMSPHDAAWLFARSLSDAAGSVTLASTLSGWGGVEMLAPLVARLGGDGALAAVADALHGADAWLAWMESGDRND